MGVIINEIKDNYEILLHKVNDTVIGQIPFFALGTINNSMDEIGTITLTVNKYYIDQIDKTRTLNPMYDEIKAERMISLDGYFYVIKEIREDTSTEVKSITAYSKEKKLEKITISVEDLGFYLLDEDEENGIFNLNDYMYEETGWKFGHVDDSVRYNEDKTPKMRWQESVDNSWLDFLKQNITNQFSCYVHFDSKNQLVNLYDMSSFGENLNIALSYDNYIKSLEKTSSSSDIVTKMKLIGNEDECIISEATVTGLDYIENYSYFIENREMSDALINALSKYDEMTAQRNVTWKQLRNNKVEKSILLTKKKNEEKVVLDNISVLEINHKYYLSNAGTDADPTGAYAQLAVETAEQIQEYQNKSKDLYKEIQTLEEEISAIEQSILNINILCRKPSATDENGARIFTDELLDELKKFIFYETFSDDSYYEAEDMIKDGEYKLNVLCRPTRTWDIDVQDFTSRIMDNGYRQQWKGILGLGDVICLYDNKNDTEEFVYLVGYEKDFQNKTLTLTLSNKKESQDVVRYLNDWLKIVKSNNKLMTRNKRLLIAQKENRINITRSEVK